MATELQACGDKAIQETLDDVRAEGENDDLNREKREQDILNQIADYKKSSSEDKQKITHLEQKLKVQEQEATILKSKFTALEEELADARKNQSQNVSESQEIRAMQQKSEEILTRAKGVIFEKTKVCKNQELQIEALSQQVVSLKEVVAITKDLLDIRNIELKHLTDKLQLMEEKIGAETERHAEMRNRMEKMVQMNVELKKEYETQLGLFSSLREKYNERELAKSAVSTLRASRSEDTQKQLQTDNETNDQSEN